MPPSNPTPGSTPDSRTTSGSTTPTDGTTPDINVLLAKMVTLLAAVTSNSKTNTKVTEAKMPDPADKGARIWTGTGPTLARHLDWFERKAKEAGLAEDERLEKWLEFVIVSKQDAIKGFTTGLSWQAAVALLKQYYPNRADEQPVSISDLLTYSSEQHAKPIVLWEDYISYNEGFYSIATKFSKQHIGRATLVNDLLDEHFFRGLPMEWQTKLSEWLQRSNKVRTQNTFPSMEDMKEGMASMLNIRDPVTNILRDAQNPGQPTSTELARQADEMVKSYESRLQRPQAEEIIVRSSGEVLAGSGIGVGNGSRAATADNDFDIDDLVNKMNSLKVSYAQAQPLRQPVMAQEWRTYLARLTLVDHKKASEYSYDLPSLSYHAEVQDAQRREPWAQRGAGVNSSQSPYPAAYERRPLNEAPRDVPPHFASNLNNQHSRPPPRAPFACHMCGEGGHGLKACPQAREWERRGVLVMGDNGLWMLKGQGGKPDQRLQRDEEDRTYLTKIKKAFEESLVQHKAAKGVSAILASRSFEEDMYPDEDEDSAQVGMLGVEVDVSDVKVVVGPDGTTYKGELWESNPEVGEDRKGESVEVGGVQAREDAEAYHAALFDTLSRALVNGSIADEEEEEKGAYAVTRSGKNTVGYNPYERPTGDKKGVDNKPMKESLPKPDKILPPRPPMTNSAPSSTILLRKEYVPGFKRPRAEAPPVAPSVEVIPPKANPYPTKAMTPKDKEEKVYAKPGKEVKKNEDVDMERKPKEMNSPKK
jgi:hypothetical protein